jgi:CheY-like chemotaxis protein/nitrogen-specific signal transduction histidine kinase
VERKNSEVEQARQALEEKAKQLALTSKYKSEFLANMSHELRTPLNSLLILSDQLSKNPDGNLTPKQTEFAKTIHSSGNDLLMLINDILDLSKIESGTVVVDAGEVRLDDLKSYVERTFRHIAESKGVAFHVRTAPNVPKAIHTDAKRLQQVLKNLLSNAFKFTHHGSVTLAIDPAESGWSDDNDALNRAPAVLAFSVIDTGIGISPDKQQIIFEAFQQEDGATNRKYGGTGLGLAISRELSRLLGGEIRLHSMPGHGSTFMLYLPQTYALPRHGAKAAPGGDGVAAEGVSGNGSSASPAASALSRFSSPLLLAPSISEESAIPLVNELDDDRDALQPGDRVLLIVENDLGFARLLLETAREKGLKGLATSQGAAALAMAHEYKPHAMTLDIFLPDIDGWRVLDRLKNDLTTRHIPIYVISTDEARERALASGALGFVPKPLQSKDTLEVLLDSLDGFLNRGRKRLLVAAPDAAWRERVMADLAGDDVELVPVGDRRAVRDAARNGPFDCVLAGPGAAELDLSSLAPRPDRSPVSGSLPVIVFGDRALRVESERRWKRLGDAATLRFVQSPERLLDQTSLFLHRPMFRLSEERRRVLQDLHQSDKTLEGKKVLIVDDDMRNIFALSSVLEEHAMEIASAGNGQDAIRILRQERDIDIVLMDIMMPGMDGFDTMREIRKIASLKNLPIVAVTAKAMKGDREKCIEAGAWDYLAKPVDPEQMLAALRAWLHR